MAKTTKQIGDAGEDRAVQILSESGYQIVERNFRTRYGEVDVIARDGKTLVFVEVKAKRDDFFGAPAEMITKAKLKKIKKTAAGYIEENEYAGPWRIDAVVIKGTQAEIIRNITN